MKIKFYYFLAAIAFFTLTTSCSDDDSNSDDEATVDSFITFTFEGDETGEFSSDANTGLQGSPNTGYQFIISRGPEDALENTSFSIFFQMESGEDPRPIPTGTFDLTSMNDVEQDDGKYSVGFTNFETDTNFGYEVNGSLNITESNENYIEGDFNFTASSFTNGELEVDVEGSFTAPITF